LLNSVQVCAFDFQCKCRYEDHQSCSVTAQDVVHHAHHGILCAQLEAKSDHVVLELQDGEGVNDRCAKVHSDGGTSTRCSGHALTHQRYYQPISVDEGRACLVRILGAPHPSCRLETQLVRTLHTLRHTLQSPTARPTSVIRLRGRV
jgi:hypothetical protein